MNSTTQFGRKKAAVGVGAVLLLAASLITVGAAVSAQSSPTADCSNDNPIQFGTQFFGSEDYDNHLVSTGPVELLFEYALPAGSYSISYVSTDAYEGRDLISQSEEQWFAQFLSADGSILATTGATTDLPDLVERGTISGSFGEVTLDADATQVRLAHIAPGSSSANSVRVVCLGATLTSEPPIQEAAVEELDLDSTITVDFDSENIDPSVISVVCGDGDPLSDEGVSVDLVIDPVAPGTTCTVEFPSEHECTMAVTADGQEDRIAVVESDGLKMITFPAAVGVDVLVDIDCNAAEDGPATCDAIIAEQGADGAVDPQTGEACDEVIEEIEPEVLSETEVNPDPPAAASDDEPVVQVLQDSVVPAQPAQPQSANPTFTG